MALTEWLSKRSRRGRERVEVDLPPLLSWLEEAVPRLEQVEVDPALVRAQLADRYRDLAIEPMAAEKFEELTAGLDIEAWRRLALAVSALEIEGLRAALARLLDGRQVALQVRLGFVEFVQATGLLTLGLLRQGPIRVEEFARHFLARLGASIRGEDDDRSRDRLIAIDYARLLAEAERARAAAEGRMETLRKLQEERAQQRGRRGKW